MFTEWSVDWASWAPWSSLLLVGLLAALGVWRFTTRKARRLERSVAARRALRERGVASGAAQLRRERQVAPKAPDTGPQERSTQAGTNSVSMPQPQPATKAATPPVRLQVDARAATVALDVDAFPMPELAPAPRTTAPEPSARATEAAQPTAPSTEQAKNTADAGAATAQAPSPRDPPAPAGAVAPGASATADGRPTQLDPLASAAERTDASRASSDADAESTVVTEPPGQAPAPSAAPAAEAPPSEAAEEPTVVGEVRPEPMAAVTEATPAPTPGRAAQPAAPREVTEVTAASPPVPEVTVLTEPPAAPPSEVTQLRPPPTSDVQARTTVLQPVQPDEAPEARATAPQAPAPAHLPATEPTPADAEALAEGIEKSRAGFWGRLRQLFASGQELDAEALADCEDVLLTCDVGVAMTDRILEALQAAAAAASEPLGEAGLRALLRRELLAVLHASAANRPAVPLSQMPAAGRPKVVLFVGVNGVGKTTTVGKVAHLLGGAGYRVVLAAGDTFRAAAAEQLAIWGERTGARVVRGAEGADPASVMYNAVEAAKAEDADIVLADTAGRLHTQNDLMDQIRKVGRALTKLRAGAPDEVWLVVDATTGQNALHQARAFHEALGLTGLVLTKLDGTSRGGVLFAIAQELQLPVRFVGLGERADSLRAFAAEPFVDALLR